MNEERATENWNIFDLNTMIRRFSAFRHLLMYQ